MTDKLFDAADSSFLDSYKNFENNFALDAQKQRSLYYEIDRRHTYLISELKTISKKDGKLSSSDVQLMKSMLMECMELADKKVGISENLMSLVSNSMSKLKVTSKEDHDATQVPQNKRNPKKFLKLAPDSEDNDSASIETSTILEETSTEEHSNLKKIKNKKTNSDKNSKISELLFSDSNQDTEHKNSESQHSKSETLKSSSSSNKDYVEPTYCICEKISYGDMVCCDNDLCPIEWFHFGCVSLNRAPKGKWYCPMCRGSSSRRMKSRKLFLKELKDYNEQKEEEFM